MVEWANNDYLPASPAPQYMYCDAKGLFYSTELT